ncbi:hypothetical protein BaRGS_00007346, partial [Batillaria attramentaria]
MHKLSALLPLFLNIARVWSTATQLNTGRVVCYINGWAQYRPQPAKFLPGLTDPFLCTHIVYAHATLNGTSLQPQEPRDVDSSVTFSEVAQSGVTRRDFAESSLQFLRQHGFDGLDVDWRYPAQYGSPAEDREKFISLLQDTREVFDKEAKTSQRDRLLLSVVVSGTPTVLYTSYTFQDVDKHVDFLNVLSMDLYGHWDMTGHPSPLYANQEDQFSTEISLVGDSVARAWTSKGVNPSRLNLGLSFHGLTFKLTSTHKTEAGAPTSGSGEAGNYTFTRGSLAFFEICQLQAASAATIRYLPTQRVPYLVAGDLWVGYDDQNSLREKVRYVRDNSYGGVAVWSIDEDDYSGTFCRLEQFPLLKAVFKEFFTPFSFLTISRDVYRRSIGVDKSSERAPLSSDTSPKPDESCGRVVCYVSNSARFRPNPAQFRPSQVDAKLCTHFVFAHALLDGTDLKPQYPGDVDMYKRMVDIRKRWSPTAKVLLSVGGWEMGSAPFSRLVASESAVKVFAEKAAIFLRTAGFDGLDVDWRYPASRGSSSRDKQLFTKFLEIVREEFDKQEKTMLLTTTIYAQNIIINMAYELPDIITRVEFANFMTYGLHGPWEGKLEHHSPLHSFSPAEINGRSFSVCKATEIMEKRRVPKAKLNMGLSFLARSFTRNGTSETGVVTSGRAGNYTMHK